MPYLSPHFQQAEFELDAPLPADVVPSYTALCVTLLEPIRAQFGPLQITSGYRTPASNAAAHGVPTSEHVATAAYCAADFKPVTPPQGAVNQSGVLVGSPQDIFDFVRNNPKLAWGQVIWEKDPGGDIVHLSWEASSPRRMALSGATHNAEPYVTWSVVPFQP